MLEQLGAVVEVERLRRFDKFWKQVEESEREDWEDLEGVCVS